MIVPIIYAPGVLPYNYSFFSFFNIDFQIKKKRKEKLFKYKVN
jgi:hypothetical protein